MRHTLPSLALAAVAMIAAMNAFAADPITEFLLNSSQATVDVPPVSNAPLRQKQSAPAAGDDALELEPPFGGGKPYADAIAKRFTEAKNLMERICRQPSNQAYFAKTPCWATKLTDAQASDSSRITDEESRAAQRVFLQTATVNNKTRRMMLASGIDSHRDAVRRSESVNDPRVKDMQNKLLSGQITWGEYNRRRQALTRRAR